MFCQKCRTPLKLDPSLEDLNPAAFELLQGMPKLSLHFPSRVTLLTLSGSTGKSVVPHSSAKLPYTQDRRGLYDRVSSNAPSPVFKRSVPAARHNSHHGKTPPQLPNAGRDSAAMSFVMLTDSQVVPQHTLQDTQAEYSAKGKSKPQLNSPEEVNDNGNESSLADRVEQTARLFEILSARSDVDHPICVECTDLLIDGMQKRLAATTKERNAYVSFVRDLNTSVPSKEDVKEAEESLRLSKEKEHAALQELIALEKEKAEVDAEIHALENESSQLDAEEAQFWRDRNAFALTLAEFQNERDALNTKYDHDSRQFERLQRTNVYNDTFCIEFDGRFVTINGLRLGRHQQLVDWSEINAAWGQALLLLHTIAEKLDFKFQSYRLKPMGSTSKIEKVDYFTTQEQPQNGISVTAPKAKVQSKVTSYDLFVSHDVPAFTQAIFSRKVNGGMTAFLDCVRQLGAFIKENPGSRSHVQLPYTIHQDRINDARITLGFTPDEEWSRACKYTLTCCKYLLAHVCNVGRASNTV